MTGAVRRILFPLGLSTFILVPTWWLPRIASADLASHTYNAWLTLELRAGRIDGLEIASQKSNIAFDSLLLALIPAAGYDAAQKLAVSLCVLLLFWASFFLLRQSRPGTPWHLIPSLAMLCYGFVFHVGLFNFYLSLGCSILALGLLMKPAPARYAGALAAAAAGAVAHPLPVGWGAAVAVYAAAAGRIDPRRRIWFAAAVLAVVALGGAFIRNRMISRWTTGQLFCLTGADQALVGIADYLGIAAVWLLWWGALLVLEAARRGWSDVATSIPFQIVVLNAAGIAAIPTSLLLPGYPAGFQLLAERMGLAQGIMVCLLLSRGAATPARIATGCVIAAVFFGTLYRSDRALIAGEDRAAAAVASLPAGSRVVSGFCSGGRLNYAYHLLDRACIGRCFSYANFEPSSGQFRLRVKPGSRIAVDNIHRADEFEEGTVTVLAAEAPLYRVEPGPGDSARVRLLGEGDTIGPPCGPDSHEVHP